MSPRPAKNILFVVPYPTGQAPSQRFRFELFYPLLKERSIHFEVSSFWDDSAWRVLYLPGQVGAKVVGLLRGFARRFTMLFTLGRFDAVLVHREMTPVGPPIFEWIVARLLGKPIVYDFDDAIWLPNVSEVNRVAGGLKWHSKVGSICGWARRVSCGNAHLAEYAQRYNDDVVVVPTVVDTAGRHNVTHEAGDELVIGWTGSHSTVAYLEGIVPALRALAERVPYRFRLIADRGPDFDIPNLEFVKWRKESEIEDLNGIDVGLMPIPDTEWAKGKCGLKIIQYMALGIPTVAAAVGVNRDIIDDGVDGFLASDNTEWEEHLYALATDPDQPF